MLQELFRTILGVSVSAAVVGLLLLIIRWFFVGKAKRIVLMLVWSILLIRLLIPYTPSSPFSLFQLAPEAIQDLVALKSTSEPTDIADLFVEPTVPLLFSEQEPIIMVPVATQEIPTDIPIENHTSLLPVLSIVWLCGCTIMFLWIVLSNLFFTWQLRRNRKYTEPDFGLRMQAARDTVGLPLHMRIRTVAVAADNSPAVFGILRPKLLLPIYTFTSLSDQDKHYVLCHELTHIRCGHVFLRLLALILLSIHWFNPVLWILYPCFLRDLEMFCDARTSLAIGQGQRQYAHSLLNVAKSMRNPIGRAGLVLTAMHKKNDLRWRIDMLMRLTRRSRIVSMIAVLLMAVCTLVSCTSAPRTITAIVLPEVTRTFDQLLKQIPDVTSMDHDHQTPPENAHPFDSQSNLSILTLSPHTDGSWETPVKGELLSENSAIYALNWYRAYFSVHLDGNRTERYIFQPTGMQSTVPELDILTHPDTKIVKIQPVRDTSFPPPDFDALYVGQYWPNPNLNVIYTTPRLVYRITLRCNDQTVILPIDAQTGDLFIQSDQWNCPLVYSPFYTRNQDPMMPEEQAAQLHQMAYDYIFTLWNCLYTLESPILPDGVPPTEYNLLPYEFADVYIEEAKDDPSLAFAEPPTITLTSPSNMLIYYKLHAEEGPVVSNYQYSCTIQGISRTGKLLEYQLNYKPTFRCTEDGKWYFAKQGGIVWDRGGTDGRYGNALSDLLRRLYP